MYPFGNHLIPVGGQLMLALPGPLKSGSCASNFPLCKGPRTLKWYQTSRSSSLLGPEQPITGETPRGFVNAAIISWFVYRAVIEGVIFSAVSHCIFFSTRRSASWSPYLKCGKLLVEGNGLFNVIHHLLCFHVAFSNVTLRIQRADACSMP